MAQHKSTVVMRLLVLFLGFSCLLSSLAVPSTRSPRSGSEEDDDEVSAADLLTQDEIIGMTEGGGMAFMERRMKLERNDYPGSEANIHHDPRTPGRA